MHLKIKITKIFDVYRGNEKTEKNIGVAVGVRWLIVSEYISNDIVIIKKDPQKFQVVNKVALFLIIIGLNH